MSKVAATFFILVIALTAYAMAGPLDKVLYSATFKTAASVERIRDEQYSGLLAKIEQGDFIFENVKDAPVLSEVSQVVGREFASIYGR